MAKKKNNNKKEETISKTIRYTFYFDESKAPEHVLGGLIDPTKIDNAKVALKELYSVDVQFKERPEMFEGPLFYKAISDMTDQLFHTFFKCSIEEVVPESNIIIP